MLETVGGPVLVAILAYVATFPLVETATGSTHAIVERVDDTLPRHGDGPPTAPRRGTPPFGGEAFVQPFRQLGAVMVYAVGLSLVAATPVLPSILVLWDPWHHRQGAVPPVDRGELDEGERELVGV